MEVLKNGTKVLFQRHELWHDNTWYTGIITGYQPLTDCYQIKKDDRGGLTHTTSERVKKLEDANE